MEGTRRGELIFELILYRVYTVDILLLRLICVVARESADRDEEYVMSFVIIYAIIYLRKKRFEIPLIVIASAYSRY